MDKMRQFSFQDHATSKQSDATLDSITSNLSSCNNRNFGQELQDNKGVNSLQNPLNTQSPLKDSKLSPKNVLIGKQKREEKENFNAELRKENISSPNHRMIKESAGENLEDEKALLQEKWKNEFKESDNHLQENWKKINKINKLLAEHKKKKANKPDRSPLSQLKENGGLKEIDQNIQQSPIIKEKKKKGTKTNAILDEKKNSNQQDVEPLEVDDESYSNEFFNERPEQIFSAALVEPFSPALTQQLISSKYNNGLQYPKNQNSLSQKCKNKRTEEDTLELEPKIESKLKDIESNDPDSEIPVFQVLAENEIKSKNKINDKKIPIEERFRLKQIEREIKLTCLREERTRNLMKEMKEKPQISENSLKIAKNSRRSRENEQVLERLSVPESKKVLLLGTPKCTEPSEYQNQSKMSQALVTHGRNTHEEKPLGSEVDSNINVYKKNNRQASIIDTHHSVNYFGSYAPGTDGPSQAELLQHSEYSQQNYPSNSIKEISNIEQTDSLQGYPSDNSLQKQASDRLIQAIAKKGISQSSGISPLSVKPEECYKNESSVPLSPMSIYPPSGIDKTKEIQDSYRGNIEYEQDVPIYGSIHTEQESITSLKTPKHIYLSLPKDMIENHSIQTNSQEGSHNIYNQKLTYSNIYGNIEDHEVAYKINKKESAGIIHNSDYYGEIKKRSTRQPTFGCSPAKKGTNHSSKLASHDMPAEMVTGGFNEKKNPQQIDYHAEYTETSTRVSTGRPSNESLMNSLRLRQQKFGLILRDPNQMLTKNLMLGDEKPWSDIDVYMRNSIWLSAKNNKVAAMNLMKENQEMKECTFHPILTEKYNSSRSLFKSASKMTSERGYDRTRDILRQKKGVSSYKDLYNHKLRAFDQQQTTSVTSPSNHIEQDYVRECEIEQDSLTNMAQQEEQKFM